VATESAPPETASSTRPTRRNIRSVLANAATRAEQSPRTGVLLREEPLPPITRWFGLLFDRWADDGKWDLSIAGISELTARFLLHVRIGRHVLLYGLKVDRFLSEIILLLERLGAFCAQLSVVKFTHDSGVDKIARKYHAAQKQ
jgi:hypothetical protein